jgi:sulfoxide reductase heme-binding subunit YedZ
MFAFRSPLGSKQFLWALLAIPAVPMARDYFLGVWPGDLVPPSGEWSARLIVFTLILTPLSMLFRGQNWIQWLVRHRRTFGVAGFLYALLHFLFYLVDMQTLENVLAEIGALGIWTGWAAFLLFSGLAFTSNDASMRALKKGWKKLQRLAYPAALLTLVHWIYVHDDVQGALLTFAPLGLLYAWRLGFRARSWRGHAVQTN